MQEATSLSGAFAAISDDVSSIYLNPAGLSQLNFKQFSVIHNESFEGIKHDFLGIALPVKGNVLGIGIYGLYTPKDIERRSGLNETDPFEPITPIEGYFMAYDGALQAAYSFYINKKFSFGTGIKIINQTIDTYSGWSIGADLDGLYSLSNKLNLAAVIQNFGLPVKLIERYYPLPLNLKLAVAYKITKLRNSNIAFDMNFPIDNFPIMSFGIEISPVKFISLRTGYKYRIYGLELSDLLGLSAGLGMNIFNFKLDYAFVLFGVLGNSHRISFSYEFEKILPQKKLVVKPQIPVEKPRVEILPTEIPVKPPAPEVKKSIELKPEEPKVAFVSTVKFAESIKPEIKLKIKSLSPQGIILYSFDATPSTGTINKISGIIRTPETLTNISFEIQESTDAPQLGVSVDETTLKWIKFYKNFPEDIFNCNVHFAVDKAFIKKELFIYTISQEAHLTKIPVERISEDENKVYYCTKLTNLTTIIITTKP